MFLFLKNNKNEFLRKMSSHNLIYDNIKIFTLLANIIVFFNKFSALIFFLLCILFIIFGKIYIQEN